MLVQTALIREADEDTSLVSALNRKRAQLVFLFRDKEFLTCILTVYSSKHIVTTIKSTSLKTSLRKYRHPVAKQQQLIQCNTCRNKMHVTVPLLHHYQTIPTRLPLVSCPRPERPPRFAPRSSHTCTPPSRCPLASASDQSSQTKTFSTSNRQ